MKQLFLFLLIVFCPVLQAQLALPNEAGLSYGHIHLNVSDPELHKQLWVNHFGGVVVEKGSLSAIRFPNLIIILTNKEPTMDSQATVMDHFGFKVRNLEKFLTKWRTAGLSVDREFIGAEGQANAYVTLPGGVYVELQEDQMPEVEVSGYHIHFFSPDAEELLAWYTDIFSLQVRPRGSISTTTNVPGMNLSFAQVEGQRLPTQGSAIDHIGFEIDNLEAFCKMLAEKGIEFQVPFRDIPSIGLKIAFFTDPSGAYIELTEGLDEF